MTANGSSTYYRGGVMVYDGDELAYMFHPDGVVRKTNSSYIYQYNLPDHVGGTRVVLAATGPNSLTEVQRTDYYPFGTPYGLYDNLGANKYLFGGKELQDASVGGESLALYDFHARFYDPFIARWMRQDPLARKFSAASPYNYCLNNPVSYIDPDGAYSYRMDSLGYTTLVRDEHGNPIGSQYYDEVSSYDGRIKMRLHDRTILSGLSQNRGNYFSPNGVMGHYAASYNQSDVFRLYYFATASTTVEWGLEGYRTNAGTQYYIGTTHSVSGVRSFSETDGNSVFDMIFDIHSHPGSPTYAGTPGASDTDMDYVSGKYDRFYKKGLVPNGKYSEQWFRHEGGLGKFPSHYVYHKHGQILYYFSPEIKSLNMGEINSAADLIRIVNDNIIK